jgi:hypothetical protein
MCMCKFFLWGGRFPHNKSFPITQNKSCENQNNIEWESEKWNDHEKIAYSEGRNVVQVGNSMKKGDIYRTPTTWCVG